MDTVTVGEPQFEIADPGSPYLIVFLPVSIAGEPRAVEHSAIAWAAPVAFLGLPLAPSDRRYVQQRLGTVAR